ncbi:uncharacterized protein METZ01_LOCUS311869 [marine metagenome]|uniref:Uncharacterized protein n=1 Tax=marine metagenome TaxID=408172 RepID=A0A382NFB3_9ZZZZ
MNSLALKEACHELRIHSVYYQVYVAKTLSSTFGKFSSPGN